MSETIGNELTYLLPGELIVTAGAMKISTVLGSCVAVCLYDPEYKIAGMNHYMFPINKTNDTDRLRYGDTSFEDMYNQMIRMGARKNNLISRVYGGSTMFLYTGPSFNIGQQNIDLAVRILNEYQIPVKSMETGGRTGRKIVFDTSAAVISCNLLNKQAYNGI